MFRKILIANRGEIAVRILRACRELGIPTAAVFSEADRGSLHVRLADEAYPIGPAPSRESYLRIDKIMNIAKRAACDAIHPGYGFLSENPALPRACERAGITFIGPSAELIELLGDKTAARRLAQKSGIPVVPGTETPVTDPKQAEQIASVSLEMRPTTAPSLSTERQTKLPGKLPGIMPSPMALAARVARHFSLQRANGIIERHEEALAGL